LDFQHDSSSLKGSVDFAIRGRKEWQNTLRFICHFDHDFALDLAIFALVGETDTTSLACEYSCILSPNAESFWPKSGQFFSFGDATTFAASLRPVLMVVVDIPSLFS